LGLVTGVAYGIGFATFVNWDQVNSGSFQ